MPYVTGHKYKIHWRYGLDFTKMRFSQSNRWETTDKNVYFVHNFTDIRAKITFNNLLDGQEVPSNTIPITENVNYAG